MINKGPFRRAALKQYLSTMNNPDDRALFDGHVAQILEDQGFQWKESPRSVYEPEQLYTALDRYTTNDNRFEFIDEHLAFGFKKAYAIFAKPKDMATLKAIAGEQELMTAIKLEKSSGLPLMTSKRDSWVYSISREAQIRRGEKVPNPCVAYKRTQQENKTRLVWGYPLEMTCMEARFARPLIDVFKKKATPMAFGITKTEIGARVYKYFEDAQGTTVCMDFSKFDSTIRKVMIQQAFRILKTWFEEEDTTEFGWNTVVRYFIHTPIVMPDGNLYTGKTHGVPSGSYFTQLVDSIVNVALMYSLKSSEGIRFRPEALMVLGDDVIIQIEGSVDLERWSARIATYGMLVHSNHKTVVGQTQFLGAVWRNAMPRCDVQVLVEKALFPESFRKYGDSLTKGALDVVRSYASCYIDGVYLIPLLRKMQRIDEPTSLYLNQQWMTGSDRYQAEEINFTSNDARKVSLASRIMK